MEVSRSLLPEFDEEMATTRKFLERVPNEKLGWKPHEKSMTMGQLAWHLADMPSWCISTFKVDTLALSDDDYEKKVLDHLIHHRAQLGVFLRLNGIRIPGVYGPSADDMPS